MKVSIAIITHNHQRWLADAIDSALAQEANFDFEIVVGVDKSNDRTLEIARQYATHKDNVKALEPIHKKLGSKHNLGRALTYCKGEYIALMDGDDFWHCTSKIQDQISFLESNPDFSCSVTQSNIEYHGHLDKRFESNYCRTQEIWNGEDVIKTPSFCATSSMVFRKKHLCPLPEWFHHLAWGDSAMRGILAAHGKFHYLQRKATTYRCNNWGTLHQLRKKGKAFMAEATNKIQESIKDYHISNA